MTKICTICHISKDIIFFGRNKCSKDGYHYVCKECHNKKNNIFKKQNKEKIQQQAKKYYRTHRLKIKIYRKKYRKLNKEKIINSNRIYYEQHKKLTSFWLNKLENKSKVKIYQRQYKQKTKSIRNKKEKLRRSLDLKYKIVINLRTRLRLALKQNWKSGHTLELLGCSVEFLKQHLEGQFTEGMRWNNYGRGGWVIDHIKPCVLFDLTNPSEQRKCFNYKNLQPLWETDNLIKKDNYAE
jgi:hypothetical protein